MFQFWYRFVRPNISAISQGAGEAIYYNHVKPQLTDFIGKIFEEICIQYLFLPDVYATTPFPIGNIGRWWGTNSKTKPWEKLDIVAVSENQVLLGECKWRNAQVDTGIIQTFLDRGNLLPYPQKNNLYSSTILHFFKDWFYIGSYDTRKREPYSYDSF